MQWCISVTFHLFLTKETTFMNKRKATFPWKAFLKSLIAIAVPIALQNLLTTTASMVDTMMIAPLGEVNVAAIGLCAQFSSLMFAGYWGFVGGGMLFFSQFWGSKEDEGIDRSYGMTLVCMMTVASIFGCLAIFAPETVMKIYTDKESIQQIGVQYLHIVGIAYFFQVMSMACSCLLRSTERVKIPMVASIVSVASNLFLNWVFIYGHLGMPAMGIRGAAVATTCAAVINLLMIYVLAWKTAYPYLFHLRAHFRWNVDFLKIYFIKCFPILCNEILIGVGNMVINITLGRQPEHVIAALAVFRTFEGLVIGFFAGFTNASSVLVGKCVGAGELDTAFERAKRLVYLCSGVIFIVNMLVLCIHKPLLHWMSLSGDSYICGTVFLVMFAFISVIRMGNWIHNDTYRASGDATYGTVLEIVFMYALVLPCVLFTGFYLKAPYWLLFLCCYIDEPIRYVLMQIHLYSGKWIKPVTDLGRAALPEFLASRKK